MSRNWKRALILATIVIAMSAAGVAAQTPTGTLQTTEGKSIDLAEWKGKIVVLSFSGSWVPLAPKELPALQKLADRFASRDVRVFWVSINSSKPGARTYAADADLKAFATKNGYTLPVLRDADQKLYKDLALDAVPTLILLDKQGKVIRKHVGFGAESGEAYGEIIREIEHLLK